MPETFLVSGTSTCVVVSVFTDFDARVAYGNTSFEDGFSSSNVDVSNCDFFGQDALEFDVLYSKRRRLF